MARAPRWHRSARKSIYVIVWKYRVRRGSERRFEHVYGPRGAWAQFFRKGHGYLGTKLYREIGATRRYVTVDIWRSRAAFTAFQRRNRGEYQRIDAMCEALTEGEERMGAYSVLEPQATE
ncbi:MAG: antibiotic biosynthesis monooxygenase family protein [Candidatus Acidiferrales bacterium]